MKIGQYTTFKPENIPLTVTLKFPLTQFVLTTYQLRFVRLLQNSRFRCRRLIRSYHPQCFSGPRRVFPSHILEDWEWCWRQDRRHNTWASNLSYPPSRPASFLITHDWFRCWRHGLPGASWQAATWGDGGLRCTASPWLQGSTGSTGFFELFLLVHLQKPTRQTWKDKWRNQSFRSCHKTTTSWIWAAAVAHVDVAASATARSANV